MTLSGVLFAAALGVVGWAVRLVFKFMERVNRAVLAINGDPDPVNPVPSLADRLAAHDAQVDARVRAQVEAAFQLHRDQDHAGPSNGYGRRPARSYQ